MKKTFKKLMAALLAVAMLCALAVPAFAAGSNTITINGKTTGHTYEAYQVFTGDLSGNTLSNVTFGNGVEGTAILTDAGLPTSLQGAQTAAELAEKLAALNTESDDVKEFAKVVSSHLTDQKYTSTESGNTYTISGVPDGYYFIKDASDTLPEGATYSRYMLNIVQNVTINSKDTTVTLDKQIKHNEADTWGVVGDNQIGDTVEFRTITTVPNTTGYTTYDYVIYDTMSDELTSNVVTGNTNNNVIIKIDDENGTGSILNASYYTVTATGNSFTVEVDILAAQRDGVISNTSKLYTYYTGVLNENAKTYDVGNQKNEAYLKYSNNPNSDSHGETTHKTVYDWTFKIDVTKVDGADTSKTLEGAVFAISKKSDLDLQANDAGVPQNTTDLIRLVSNGNGVYTVADTTQDTTYTMTTPTDGKISIKGLDDGTYYLYETKAPDGYNKLSNPVTVVISTRTNGDYSADGNTITSAPTVTVDGIANNSMAFNVINNAGATLPSTGGIGTTIFYVVGGGLMIAAAVLLITKKRMEGKN